MTQAKWAQITAALALLLLSIHPTYARDIYWLRYEKSAQPYVAEMYSTLPKIELAKMNKFHPFYLRGNPANRAVVDAQIGFQIPFLTVARDTPRGRFKGTLMSLTSVNTLIDVMETETAPVVNNDYRMGLKFFFQYYPDNSGWFKNYHLTFLPILHESTHIGDEFAIHSMNHHPDFMRVNIGYEVWQLFVGFNRHYDYHRPNLSAEIGYQRLLSGQDGFYKIDNTEELQGHPIVPSKRRDGWFLRGEYNLPLSTNPRNRTSFVFSTEIRHDIKMGYTTQNPESRTWLGNFYAGFRMPLAGSSYHAGIYLHHYRGVIPYGQLRDVDGFRMTGLSVVVN